MLAIGFAVFLGLRGEIGVAIPLGVFGLGLLGWMPFGAGGLFPAHPEERRPDLAGALGLSRNGARPRQRRDARPHRRRPPSGRGARALDVKTLAGLLDEIDEESRALLVAYLDRRDPGWSEHAQGHAAAGRAAASSGKMTEQEAYQILGVAAGRERRRHHARAPHADEETASRPRGVDVSRGPHQRGQGNPFSPPSLRYSLRNTISGSWVSAHPCSLSFDSCADLIRKPVDFSRHR